MIIFELSELVGERKILTCLCHFQTCLIPSQAGFRQWNVAPQGELYMVRQRDVLFLERKAHFLREADTLSSLTVVEP